MTAPMCCHQCGAPYKRFEIRVLEWFEQNPHRTLKSPEIAALFGRYASGSTTVHLRGLVNSGHLGMVVTKHPRTKRPTFVYSLGPKAKAEMAA